MNKDRKFYKNTFHHLYNRGVNGQTIFKEKGDYIYFLSRLKLYFQKYDISILVYSLMPNHFHMFVKQNTDDKTIGKFIGDLTNSYTKFFNTKYNRNGVLFQGRTKSKNIDDEYYFTWVIKYILINPVKANLVRKPEQWEFSNAPDLFRLRKDGITDVDRVFYYFDSEKQFREFISDTDKPVSYEF